MYGATRILRPYHCEWLTKFDHDSENVFTKCKVGVAAHLILYIKGREITETYTQILL